MNNDLNVGIFLTQSDHMTSEDFEYGTQEVKANFNETFMEFKNLFLCSIEEIVIQVWNSMRRSRPIIFFYLRMKVKFFFAMKPRTNTLSLTQQ